MLKKNRFIAKVIFLNPKTKKWWYIFVYLEHYR